MHYFEQEKQCEECGELFWSPRAKRFCSRRCNYRHWRARNRSPLGQDVLSMCQEMVRRSGDGESWSKLLPGLFRACGLELRRRGIDPYSLMLSWPDAPAHPDDAAPGGTDGAPPSRTRWLHPPEQELQLLSEEIERRESSGHSAAWHRDRRAQLARYLLGEVQSELDALGEG